MDSEVDKFRHRALAKRVVTVNELRREICPRWGKAPDFTQQSMAIPVPLYHGETFEQYSHKFEQWLAERHESLTMLQNDPTRERSFWFTFAYLRVRTIDTVKGRGRHQASRKRYFEHEGYQLPSDHTAVEMKRARSTLPADHREEKSQLASDVISQEAQVDETLIYKPSLERPRCQAEYLRETTERRQSQPPCLPQQKLPELSLPDSYLKTGSSEDEHLHSRWTVLLINRILELENNVMELRKEIDSNSITEGASVLRRETTENAHGSNSMEYQVTVEAPNNSSRSKAVPEKLKLYETYNHLNNQIMTNETAVSDALAQIKEVVEIDDTKAKGCERQVLELATCIRQEKEKRDSVLAQLIVAEWTEQKETLMTLLNEEPAKATRSIRTTHEKMAVISSEIKSNENELERLRAQFDDQVLLVNSLPPSATGAGRALRMKQLKKLSERLNRGENTRVLLEEERRKVMLCCVKQDKKIRMLILNMLRKKRKC